MDRVRDPSKKMKGKRDALSFNTMSGQAHPSFFFTPSVFAPTSPTRSWSTASSRQVEAIPPLSSASRGGHGVDMKDCTGDEYIALPPVVKKKFFSTLERLRLAQEPPARPHPFGQKRTTSSPLTKTRWTANERRPSLRLSRSGPTRQQSITQGDADWFLALPDKVKSRHFTKEERALLAGKCATVIMDATDDAFYRRRELQSLATTPISHSPRSSADSETDRAMLHKSDQVDDGFDDPLQWLEDDDNFGLQLRLDDYRAHIAAHDKTFTAPLHTRSRRSSLRRAQFSRSRLSGRGLVFPAHQTSTEPQLQSIKVPKPLATESHSAAAPKNNNRASGSSSGDSEATYYQDPEARLKLRVYLASPQKFDETVEFGFPSANPARKGTVESRRGSKYGSRLSQSDMQTFLNDDASLLYDDDEETSSSGNGEEDDPSLPDTDLPVTPSELDSTAYRSPHRLPYAAKLHSSDSTRPMPAGTRPRLFESYAYAPSTDREMTLRITLTRPELRPYDSDGVGSDGVGGGDSGMPQHHPQGREKDDPLALAELPSMGSKNLFLGAGLRGTMDKSDNNNNGRMKSFWKRLKSKPKMSL